MGKWRVLKVDGPLKVDVPTKMDGPSKVDGLLTKRGGSEQKFDGLLTESGWSWGKVDGLMPTSRWFFRPFGPFPFSNDRSLFLMIVYFYLHPN